MESKVLDVPYLTQPTPITCQSTCLKMFGLYVSAKIGISSPIEGMDIQDIWTEINQGQNRPALGRNSYQNMAWWLNTHLRPYKFEVKSSKNTDDAIKHIVGRVKSEFPVMVSTNHSRTDGHIILVVGYAGHSRDACSSTSLVCHDPYGKFNPKLGSKLHGGSRFETGMSLADGGEVGPGKSVRYDYEGIRRIRKDKHSSGTYFMVSATA